MQYHVKSLIEENFNVDLIGYFESPCIDEIAKNATVKLHNLTQFPSKTQLISLVTHRKLIFSCFLAVTTFPTPAKYFFKTLWQILGLLLTLFSVRAPEYVLVQNPPAIPTLICCYFYCLLSRCKLIIDWHNYTYTILALNSSSGEKSLIVRLAKRIEAHFGRKSYANLCVTEAMKNDLMERWNIQ
jgi:beta-1,4-mannosyltransferase